MFWFFSLNRKYFYLFAFVVLSVITETILFFNPVNNLVYINLHGLLEFLIIALLFRHIFIESLWKKYSIMILICYLLFGIGNMFFIQGSDRVNSYTLMFESILVVSLSLLLYWQCLQNNSQKINFLYKPEFWFGAAFLIYFGGNFFIFANSYEYLSLNSKATFNIWNLHSILNILLNLLLTSAVWFSRKKYE